MNLQITLNKCLDRQETYEEDKTIAELMPKSNLDEYEKECQAYVIIKNEIK